MKVFVFLGPSLRVEDARRELEAHYLPPVAQGDVLRVVKEAPFAIGIIDGQFERTPAVWHKEILWALSKRIHVFGGASMGAMRAAELSSFGMQGVGDIYAQFQSGGIEDDDEVAVAHGDASTGYRATSEAMVNIRATLNRAEQTGIVSRETRLLLERAAKRLFYPDRTYRGLLAAVVERGELAPSVTNALRDFIAVHRVDAKGADAVSVLRALRQCVDKGEPAPEPRFSFSHTDAWEQLVQSQGRDEPEDRLEDARRRELAALAAEVRLLGSRGDVLSARALARCAAVRWRRAAGDLDLPGTPTKAGDVAFERSQDAFASLSRAPEDARLLELEHELRASGSWDVLDARRRHKECLLKEKGYERPSARDTGLETGALLSWYLRERRGETEPSDPAAAVTALGLPDVASLESEAAREFLYLQRLRE